MHRMRARRCVLRDSRSMSGTSGLGIPPASVVSMAPSARMLNDLASRIIGAAIEVHRELGPGLLENAYLPCLDYQLRDEGLRTQCQLPLPLVYRTLRMDCVYRADLVVEDCLLVEVKAVETTAPVHEQQVYTYLRLGDYRLGLLLNFGGATLKEGIRRIVNRFPDE